MTENPKKITVDKVDAGVKFKVDLEYDVDNEGKISQFSVKMKDMDIVFLPQKNGTFQNKVTLDGKQKEPIILQAHEIPTVLRDILDDGGFSLKEKQFAKGFQEAFDKYKASIKANDKKVGVNGVINSPDELLAHVNEMLGDSKVESPAFRGSFSDQKIQELNKSSAELG